jgi:recombination protein RecA
MYGEGISESGDLLDLAATANMVEKSGAWYSYQGERMGQGRDQAKQFLKDHPEIMTELRNKILASHGIGKLLMSTPEAGAEGSEADAMAEEVESTKAAKKEKTEKKAKH